MHRTKQIRRDTRQMLEWCIGEDGLSRDHVLQVVDLVSKSSSRDRFETLKVFRRLVRMHQNSHRANVESAVPLSPEMQQRVEQGLQQNYQSDFKVTFATNPELIGGMRIEVADDVYDSSVRGKLTELERQFSDSMNDK